MKVNRATGRAVIETILQNMQDNLEPLQYKTLAPTLYRVYLNDEDYHRLEGIFPEIIADARRALQDELDRLNEGERQAWLVRKSPLLRKLFKEDGQTYQASGGGWEIQFSPDMDGELNPGDVAVSSQLMPTRQEEVAGKKTRRVTTRKSGAEVKSHSTYEQAAPVADPARAAYAKISFEDNQGAQTFQMRINRIKIGRGGIDHWVDLKLETLPDVSREHVHLRYDEAARQFYITDRSTYGTTLDGRELKPGVEELLPDRARIGLAGVIFLDFEATGNP